MFAKAILGENDEVWVRYRHEHIEQVNENVREDIQSFMRENATAQMQKNMVGVRHVTLKCIVALCSLCNCSSYSCSGACGWDFLEYHP